MTSDSNFWRWIAATEAAIILGGISLMGAELMRQLRGERAFVIEDFAQWTQDRVPLLERLNEIDRQRLSLNEKLERFRDVQVRVLARIARVEERLKINPDADDDDRRSGVERPPLPAFVPRAPGIGG